MIKREEIEKIMSPFNHKDMEEKSSLELFQATLLILALNKDVKIIEADREKPDILLESDTNIGLEITKIRKEPVNLIRQSIFDDVQKEFEKVESDISGFFNFYTTEIFPSNPSRVERTKIIEVTVDYIQRVIKIEVANNPKFFETIKLKILDEDTPKPEFIKEILFMKANKLSFFFNEGVTTTNPLYEAKLLETELEEVIKKKEEKIESYIRNSKTKRQWLLIVNDDVSSESYDTEDFEGLPDIESKFEKIFLLTTFNGEIIKIK